MPIKMSLPDDNAKKKMVVATGGYQIKSGSNSNSTRYAHSSSVNLPITKNSQWAGSGANVTFTQPMFFSPLHTPQNWQIASKRREIYQWQILEGQGLIAKDFTEIPIEKLDFLVYKIINDEITGGLLYDDIDSEFILGGSGKHKKPVKYSVRECKDKRCFSFSAYGNWRELKVSEEHPIFVLDGKWYRKKKKLEIEEKRRREKGMPQGTKRIKVPVNLIVRKEAKDVRKEDFLITPVPKCGNISLDNNKAWAIGLCAADGGIGSGYASLTKKSSYKIYFTGDREEKSMEKISEILEGSFEGRVWKAQHETERGLRVQVTRKNIWEFFNNYITGKLSKKKFTSNVFELDKESRLKLLGGYFDGDGHFSQAEKKLVANNYSKDMADQIYWLLLSVDIQCSIGKYKISNNHYDTNSTHYYRIFIPSSEIKKIQPYMESDKIPNNISIKSKRNLRFFYKENGKTYLAQPIKDIEEFKYTGRGYDLQIDPERSFVASSFKVSNCRFYYENEPKVAAGVDFYSQFSMNSFVLECSDQKVLKYFEKVVKDLKLNHWLKLISHEYFLLGDVFPFTEIQCDKCGGSGRLADGNICNHPGGKIKRIVVMNPDWIEVQSNVLAEDPITVLIPDETLKQIIMQKEPRQLYDRLPQKLINTIAAGQPIVLSNRCVSHLKHNASPYGTYGVSLLRRLFTILAYKTKLMTANWIVAERLILPVRVVKVGDKERPASPDDILDISNQISAVANDPNTTIVTHHAFDMDWYGACYDSDTKVLTNKGLQYYNDIIHEEIDGNGNIRKVIDEDIEIMVFNPETGQMIYEKPLEFHEYEYDGFLNTFTGNKIDMAVTPNHTMLGYKRDKTTAYSMQARDFSRINECDRYVRACADYLSKEKTFDYINIADHSLDLDTFLEFAGYYLAEGYSIYDESKRQYRISISQCPRVNGDKCEELDDIFKRLNIKSYKYSYDYCVNSWDIFKKNFVREIKDLFGDNSHTKKIPQFIKNLPPEKLKLLINSYCRGDASYHSYKDSEAVQIGTMSEQLREDLFEILFKSGYSPIKSNYNKVHYNNNTSYMIYCNITEGKGKGRFSRIKDNHCDSSYYKGKVWCFETSTGFFVTERNGKFAIQGNTGKIHNITSELEQIGKEILDGLMLNQSLLNGEMTCHDEDTMTLTDSGFKHYTEITEKDKIACYNPETEKLEYHNYICKNVYDYNGEMVKFQTDKIDILVTPNHRMWVQPRDHDGFKFVDARDVKRGSKIIGRVEDLKEYSIESKEEKYAHKEITKVDYDGKVYCFMVPHGLFVTKRNGKITIQGNSYSSAQVGVETMIRRLESWRSTLAEWVENNIFLPISMMQGFVDEKESKELRETVYTVPTLKWNDLNLRDKSNHLQLMLQLNERQKISDQKLLEEFDIDYDQEVERMREEQALAGPAGQLGAGGGMAGGMPGGMMGGLGGGGGAMPGGDMGGVMPGGEMGGAMPGGDMAGGMPGGMPGGEMGAAANIPSDLKIGKKGKGSKSAQEQTQAPQPRVIKLTRLEQKMYKILQGANIPHQLFGQYAVRVQGENQPFVLDFAYPSLGIGIEADGKTWHEKIEAQIRDKQRDEKLANIGWRIIRFKENAIQDQPDRVAAILSQHIQDAIEEHKKKSYQELGLYKEAGKEITLENLLEENIIYSKKEIEGGLGYIYFIGTGCNE